jgi:ribonuclease HI
VIYTPTGAQLTVGKKYLGIKTNNEAEYLGLILGLELADELGIKRLQIRGDSQLVISQMQGKWGVKAIKLSTLYASAKLLTLKLDECTFTWVPRAQNHVADAMCNHAIKEGNAFVI